ncbi:MAG TPA: L,D-transpeptidase family protein [Acidimicrobiales bacterium]|nr:L,D-transpeptidase family protein [Acidimicrobiales bacterium]
MDRAWGRRVVLAAVAALGIAGVTASAIMAPGLSPEGGFGHAVAAAQPSPPHPERWAGAKRAVASLADTPAPTLIATLSAATPYSASPGGQPTGTLPATNPFGAPEVFAVVGQPDPSGWLQVELPIRPNGSLGWIPAAGVTLTQTTYRVVVNRAADTLTVFNGTDQVTQFPAAVGKPSSPTPAGNTYLWELIRPDNPNGAYGPYIFGLAWFSDTYATFNGGNAQIGIHGQDEPWSVGHPVSHGCVRLDNSAITQLAGLLPLGTPVTIS